MPCKVADYSQNQNSVVCTNNCLSNSMEEELSIVSNTYWQIAKKKKKKATNPSLALCMHLHYVTVPSRGELYLLHGLHLHLAM